MNCSVINVGANAITDGRFEKGIGPVHMSSVNCRGDEMKLGDCSHSNGIGVTNCHHGRDAGVMCEGWILYYCVVCMHSTISYNLL